MAHDVGFVELREVTRIYESGASRIAALDGVTEQFPTGSWTAVMGPSGSGKSTLLHCAAGLERPSSGQVLLSGRDITHTSETELTRLRQGEIGFVFQNFNLIGSLTAAQNVEMPMRLAGRRLSPVQVREVLGKVGLEERAHHKPRELSGGQQQRVAIARAMVTRPAVLFADEPTGALDSHAARRVLGMLRAMVESGQTTVMVTHDPMAAASADQVMFLSDGRVVDRVMHPTAARGCRSTGLDAGSGGLERGCILIRLSWSTFRERWQLFVGAVLAVALGVALVQASLLLMLAAASPRIPSDLSPHTELVLRDAYRGAVSLSAIVMVITTFVAIFVVGSTFAFTVAQRRRDLALLRLTGATPRQVRRLLRGEAVLLGAIGSAIGIVLGLLVTELERSMYVHFDFVPDGFSAPWHWWVAVASSAVGVTIAVLGCVAASRRAGRVRALDALRHVGAADRVMTGGRWVVGLVAGAIATAFVLAAAASQGAQAMDAAVPACLFWVLSLSALSPVTVPLAGRLFDAASNWLLPHSRLGQLVNANLRDGVRRTASTAAPVILLVGLVVGLAGTVRIIDAGRLAELERTLRGDLVVVTSAPFTGQLEVLDGVRTVSQEVPVLIEMPEKDADAGVSYSTVDALAVDPEAYSRMHSLAGAPSALAGLAGDTVALDRSYASALHAQVGDKVAARLEGRVRDLKVIAVLPDTMTGPEVVLPLELTSEVDGDRRYVVELDNASGAPPVAERIQTTLRDSADGSRTASVYAVNDWIRRDVAERRRVSQNIILAILGLVTLYIAIAVVNAVVIAAADRREEFATARLTGLSRAQVVRASLWESLAVAAMGVLLGGAAAAVTLMGVSSGVSDVVGTRIIAVPWSLIGSTIAAAVALVATTSVTTTLMATRQPAITLVSARE